MKNSRIIKSNRGFTIIELLVVATLMVLVVWTAYAFFGVTGNFLDKNTEKADAQSQSRLIFQGMKIEIGSAKSVIIGNKEALEGIPGTIYFVEDDIFYKKMNGGSNTPAFGALPVKGLTIEYEKVKSKIVKITISADGGYEATIEIFSPNVPIGGNIGDKATAILIDSAT